jgi:hypothetical protein
MRGITHLGKFGYLTNLVLNFYPVPASLAKKEKQRAIIVDDAKPSGWRNQLYAEESDRIKEFCLGQLRQNLTFEFQPHSIRSPRAPHMEIQGHKRLILADRHGELVGSSSLTV